MRMIGAPNILRLLQIKSTHDWGAMHDVFKVSYTEHGFSAGARLDSVTSTVLIEPKLLSLISGSFIIFF